MKSKKKLRKFKRIARSDYDNNIKTRLLLPCFLFFLHFIFWSEKFPFACYTNKQVKRANYPNNTRSLLLDGETEKKTQFFFASVSMCIEEADYTSLTRIIPKILIKII